MIKLLLISVAICLSGCEVANSIADDGDTGCKSTQPNTEVKRIAVFNTGHGIYKITYEGSEYLFHSNGGIVKNK